MFSRKTKLPDAVSEHVAFFCPGLRDVLTICSRPRFTRECGDAEMCGKNHGLAQLNESPTTLSVTVRERDGRRPREAGLDGMER